jgi:hypothetical protein
MAARRTYVPQHVNLRVVVLKTGVEVIATLAHPHKSTWEVPAMQLGAPGSTAVGRITIPIFSPADGPKFQRARADIAKLDLFQRVEAYTGPTNAGNPKFGMIITAINKLGRNWSIEGISDIGLAEMSRPFPGEVIPFLGGIGESLAQMKNYVGMNEYGNGDNFNPYTAGNYTSLNAPGRTAGAWSSTTDDGLPAVTDSTGTGAALILKTSASANDSQFQQYVEAACRLNPLVGGGTLDSVNSGRIGVGLSTSSANLNASLLGYVTAKWNSTTGKYDLDATLENWAGGLLSASITVSNALTGVSDAEGLIPLVIGLLADATGNYLSVNGSVVAKLTTAFNPGTSPIFPLLYYGTATNPANTPSAAFFQQFVQLTRYANDLRTDSVFVVGSAPSPVHTLSLGSDPGPSFLEVIMRVAQREGWYWRYTPLRQAAGSRTIGQIDFYLDPGADLTASLTLREGVHFEVEDFSMTANADSFAADTQVLGPASSDGGGRAFFRDVGTLQNYPVIQDRAMSVTSPRFDDQRKVAYWLVQNKKKIGVSGSKKVRVRRLPDVSDTVRELDKFTLHAPSFDIAPQTTRLLFYTYVEGARTQDWTLDQYSYEDTQVGGQRFDIGVVQMASLFANRP